MITLFARRGVVAAATALAAATVATTTAVAQSPVKETLAYSRETIPGIPPGGSSGPGGPGGGPSNRFPTTYFIYIVIQKGTPMAAADACVGGKRYAATLKRVESPVAIERDPGVPTGEKETLVKKTFDDVYQVELRRPPVADCREQEKEKSAHGAEVTVFLRSGEAKWRGWAEHIIPLHPARAM